MESIFTRIIHGDMPCYKVHEDDGHIAFLDIKPLKLGHLLVVPKREIDYIFDLDSLEYQDLWRFVRKVARAMKKSIDCNRIGISVVGLEVPHVHIHLIPIDHVSDMNFERPRESFTEEQMTHILKLISTEI